MTGKAALRDFWTRTEAARGRCVALRPARRLLLDRARLLGTTRALALRGARFADPLLAYADAVAEDEMSSIASRDAGAPHRKSAIESVLDDKFSLSNGNGGMAVHAGILVSVETLNIALRLGDAAIETIGDGGLGPLSDLVGAVARDGEAGDMLLAGAHHGFDLIEAIARIASRR